MNLTTEHDGMDEVAARRAVREGWTVDGVTVEELVRRWSRRGAELCFTDGGQPDVVAERPSPSHPDKVISLLLFPSFRELILTPSGPLDPTDEEFQNVRDCLISRMKFRREYDAELSLRELEEVTGIPRSRLSEFEQGHYEPRVGDANKIALALGASPLELWPELRHQSGSKPGTHYCPGCGKLLEPGDACLVVVETSLNNDGFIRLPATSDIESECRVFCSGKCISKWMRGRKA